MSSFLKRHEVHFLIKVLIKYNEVIKNSKGEDRNETNTPPGDVKH